MSALSGGPVAARPPWLIDRDLDAVAAHLDRWILAAEPHDNAATTTIPLLGTPEWVAADQASHAISEGTFPRHRLRRPR
jgi:hypothetical protein